MIEEQLKMRTLRTEVARYNPSFFESQRQKKRKMASTWLVTYSRIHSTVNIACPREKRGRTCLESHKSFFLGAGEFEFGMDPWIWKCP